MERSQTCSVCSLIINNRTMVDETKNLRMKNRRQFIIYLSTVHVTVNKKKWRETQIPTESAAHKHKPIQYKIINFGHFHVQACWSDRNEADIHKFGKPQTLEHNSTQKCEWTDREEWYRNNFHTIFQFQKPFLTKWNEKKRWPDIYVLIIVRVIWCDCKMNSSRRAEIR